MTLSLFAAVLHLIVFSAAPDLRDRNIPVIIVREHAKQYAAIVDTGGVTESAKANPGDFKTYYRNVPVTMAIGADYLQSHAVQLQSGTPKPKHTIPIDVRRKGRLTAAFVTCTIGGKRLTMLLDSAALAWKGRLSNQAPAAVVFLREAPFRALRRMHPDWLFFPGAYEIANGDGRFTIAAAMVAPQTDCEGVRRNSVTVVERLENDTFNVLRRSFGIATDGDASLAVFASPAILIDFPRKTLAI